MTRDDIIRMAREAGFSVIDSPESWNESTKILERFAALVRADEREACAKVCDGWAKYGIPAAAACAAVIRARSKE